ncbi:MAG: ABC transporter permease [Beijerinckiaceae bacterium]|jgi:putative hydroxymethylpyrimidine transport system permease protein|nr:ABC transporter permease [Beijerinckiaceae bacterium]
MSRVAIRELTAGVIRFALSVGFVVILWQLVVSLTGAPHFILPGPVRVARVFWSSRELILENALITWTQIVAGLLLGALFGISTAINLAMSPVARVLIRPFIVFAQAVPVFALAPVLTLWLGYGMASKIVVVVLMIYFPVASAFFDGLMRTPQGALDLAQTMNARPLQTMFRLRVPHALPALASGLRLAAVAAPLGAVIGEWVGASQGLGHLMLLANGRAQTDLMFAALLALAAFTVVLYFCVDRFGVWLAERYGGPPG